MKITTASRTLTDQLLPSWQLVVEIGKQLARTTFAIGLTYGGVV